MYDKDFSVVVLVDRSVDGNLSLDDGYKFQLCAQRTIWSMRVE